MTYARVQYNNIFQTVPVLLEHFIEVLEDKPEVLEKSDLKMFTMDNSRAMNTDYNVEESPIEEGDIIRTPSVYGDGNENLKYNASSSDEVWELSADRIIEKTLEVERLLEDYNN